MSKLKILSLSVVIFFTIAQVYANEKPQICDQILTASDDASSSSLESLAGFPAETAGSAEKDRTPVTYEKLRAEEPSIQQIRLASAEFVFNHRGQFRNKEDETFWFGIAVGKIDPLASERMASMQKFLTEDLIPNSAVLERLKLEAEFYVSGEAQLNRYDLIAPKHDFKSLVQKKNLEYVFAESFVRDHQKVDMKKRLSALQKISKKLPPISHDEALRILLNLPKADQLRGYVLLKPLIFTDLRMYSEKAFEDELKQVAPLMRRAFLGDTTVITSRWDKLRAKNAQVKSDLREFMSDLREFTSYRVPHMIRSNRRPLMIMGSLAGAALLASSPYIYDSFRDPAVVAAERQAAADREAAEARLQAEKKAAEQKAKAEREATRIRELEARKEKTIAQYRSKELTLDQIKSAIYTADSYDTRNQLVADYSFLLRSILSVDEAIELIGYSSDQDWRHALIASYIHEHAKELPVETVNAVISFQIGDYGNRAKIASDYLKQNISRLSTDECLELCDPLGQDDRDSLIRDFLNAKGDTLTIDEKRNLAQKASYDLRNKILESLAIPRQ